MRYAVHTGMRPRDAMALDTWEWVAVLAYLRLEPFGPLRDDLRAAEIVCATANVWGNSLKPERVFGTLRCDEPAGPPAEDRAARVAAERQAWLQLCPALSPVSANTGIR